MDPLVTICIPTYRRLQCLKESVASALEQTYPAVEVVIGDDGDVAELRAWATDLAARDPRVRYQKNPTRLGLAGNWNAVAESARGEYLAIIGDDDRLRPRFVERLMAAREGETAVIFCNHDVIDERGVVLHDAGRRLTREYGRDRLSAGRIADPFSCVWRNSVPMSASLVRSRDVQRLAFKPDLNTPEIELFVRMAGEGGQFVFVPDVLAEYRVHAGSATAAGLWSDSLVKYLEPIETPPHAEEAKRRFMTSLLVQATGVCLLRGDPENARRFLRNQYYPARTMASSTVAVQRVAALLPPRASRSVYSLGQRMVQTVRSLARRAEF